MTEITDRKKLEKAWNTKVNFYAKKIPFNFIQSNNWYLIFLQLPLVTISLFATEIDIDMYLYA